MGRKLLLPSEKDRRSKKNANELRKRRLKRLQEIDCKLKAGVLLSMGEKLKLQTQRARLVDTMEQGPSNAGTSGGPDLTGPPPPVSRLPAGFSALVDDTV